jgi:ribonuclease HI
MKYIVYTDGGSRGNPWPSGCWVYITTESWDTLEKRFKYIGIATNNIAEYTAAFLGISRAIELGATEIELRADSKLVIEQLSGNYKIKNVELKKIFLQIWESLQNWWGNIIFTHVFREQNIEADRLSNIAMDKWI